MLTLKTTFGDDTRRRQIAATITFAELRALVAATHGVANAQLKYVDDDGDQITIGNDADVQEATRLATSANAAVRIVVAEVKPVAAAAPAVDATSGEPIRHAATCDHCNKPIFGARFKCGNCADYDLCAFCEAQHARSGFALHDRTHLFVKIDRAIPVGVGALLPQVLAAPGNESRCPWRQRGGWRRCGRFAGGAGCVRRCDSSEQLEQLAFFDASATRASVDAQLADAAAGRFVVYRAASPAELMLAFKDPKGFVVHAPLRRSFHGWQLVLGDVTTAHFPTVAALIADLPVLNNKAESSSNDNNSNVGAGATSATSAAPVAFAVAKPIVEKSVEKSVEKQQQQPVEQSVDLYALEHSQLRNMGFQDAPRNAELLARHDGDVLAVVQSLLG